MAGVSIPEGSLHELNWLGVKDSKLLSATQREALYAHILRLCDRVESVKIPPAEIDRVVRTGRRLKRLNFLEASYMAGVIDRLGAETVWVDSCDTRPERFGETISSQMKGVSRVVARHHADRDFVVVSAASVVAKVERDIEIEKLRALHGDFGSGYPSDPKTRVFFIEWLSRGQALPPFVRKSWRTWDRLEQSVLFPL